MTGICKNGKLISCTVLETKPCVVTQIKTLACDGYEAVQLAYDKKKEKKTSKPLCGHFKAANTPPRRKLVEFRNFAKSYEKADINLGDNITVQDVFSEGEFVDAVGISKGKGFAGVMKRHGFGGVGQSTHGQHNRQRAPGSIGAGSSPSRVFKGMRMAGRMGSDRVTLKSLEIVKIIAEKGVVVIKGSVPGNKYSYIILQK